MSPNINTTKSRPKEIPAFIANPSVSTTIGGPVGFWASELTHAYYEFVESGYEVTIASSNGANVKWTLLLAPLVSQTSLMIVLLFGP